MIDKIITQVCEYITKFVEASTVIKYLILCLFVSTIIWLLTGNAVLVILSLVLGHGFCLINEFLYTKKAEEQAREENWSTVKENDE